MLYKGTHFYMKREGNDIVTYSTHTNVEYSRLNLKTGRAGNWYARTLCKKIHSLLQHTPAASLCMLGGAGGSVSYEILTYMPHVHVTTVDIDRENIIVLEHSLFQGFGDRSAAIAHDAKDYIQHAPSHIFDVIVIDVFIDAKVPAFIMKPAYLNQCFRVLKPGGRLLANIIAVPSDDTFGDLLRSTGKHVTRIHKVFPGGLANIIYEAY